MWLRVLFINLKMNHLVRFEFKTTQANTKKCDFKMKNHKYLKIYLTLWLLFTNDFITSFDSDETLLAGLLCCFLPVGLRPIRGLAPKHTPSLPADLIGSTASCHASESVPSVETAESHTHMHTVITQRSGFTTLKTLCVCCGNKQQHSKLKKTNI